MAIDNELLTLETLSAEQLADYIRQIIDSDFQRLVQLLYRLDVSEEKLKNVLADNPSGDAGALIAQLVMERMEQSKLTREKFRQQDDIPEDERW
jgi:SOS response regulatory protein OraA/RecX